MRYMFSGCPFFNQPLGKWNIKSVEELNWMFSGCISFTQSLEAWNTGHLASEATIGIFEHCPAGKLPFVKKWRKEGLFFNESEQMEY